MQSVKLIVPVLSFLLLAVACKKDSDNETPPAAPQLIFKYKFDSTQVRLDGFGNTSTVPPNHGAQSPVFNNMSSHYIELTPSAITPLGAGTVLYHAAETTAGGSNAIDFSKASIKGNGETFFSVPLSQVAAGSYNYLRVSLAYQNYDVKFRYTSGTTNLDLNGTLASFIGYDTYISSFKIKNQTQAVGGNRKQGFWAFEIPSLGVTDSGQAPPGATTVPNPLFATSAVPAGSCVVTGAFASPLTITGNEAQDIVITVSLSTNKSFEWEENSTAGYFEPAAGDKVVDMGIRGLIPIVN